MRRIICLCLLLAVGACKSRKITSESDNKYVIEELASAATGENLSQIYPDARIEEGTAYFEEGTVERPYTPCFTKALLMSF